jgi:protein-tyrosine phosphatase
MRHNTGCACKDILEYDIMRHYGDFWQIADDVASPDTPGLPLVLWAGGVNRSGTLCIAYYAVHTGIPLIQSTKECKQLRGRICGNASFQAQPFTFAQQRQLQPH